jgi:hypothetical protein
MGFFKSVAKVASSPVMALNSITAPLAVGKELFGNKPEVQGPPGVDPNVGNVKDSMFNLYNELKQNKPKLEGQAITGAQDQAKQDLAQRLYDTKALANKNGMLYSGIREKEELGQKAEASKKLGSDVAGIQKAFADQEKELQQQAFSAGVDSAQLEQDRFNSLYNAQMQQKQMNQSGLFSFLGGAGSMAGGLLGGR